MATPKPYDERPCMSGMRILLLAISALAFASSAYAQHTPAQPYAGQQHRQIKSLSSEEVDGLLQGAGLGLAKAAELNGYPGPRHVLDAADELDLSAKQQESVERIFSAMQRQARVLGQQIVDAERQLDEDFRERRITPEALEQQVSAIATLRGQLRMVHLKAHLELIDVLSPKQVQTYQRIRGYANAAELEGHSVHH